MTKFLLNAWYVGAWSEEVGRQPLGRRLLNKPVVFYRREDGAPVALFDRCPHRFVPLSKGEVVGDDLVCGYHGLSFNGQGRCTDKRANEMLKERFCVTSFPLVERYQILWIWMGDPALADPDLIPRFDFYDDPSLIVAGRGLTHLKANYTLEIDNLLDLSHLDFVHRNSISNGRVITGQYNVYERGDTVHSDWWVPSTIAPRQFQALMQLSKDERWAKAKDDLIVDHWLDMRWDAPGTLFLDVGVAPAGLDRAAAIAMPQGHFVTPETESSTHYFWAYTMPDMNIPEEFIAKFLEIVRIAFDTEDRSMLEAQQAAMASNDFWAEHPMILAEDAGAIRARRMLDKLLKVEAEAPSRFSEGSPSTERIREDA